MKLAWSRYALTDRDAIFSYIETDNPRAAVWIDEQIETAATQLIAFHDSGRPGRIAGTRELVVPGTPYILAYAVSSDTVRILRVLHGARVWPDDLAPR